jgi:hypothetical protein
MKTYSLLHTPSILSLAALLTTNVLAGPGQQTATANSEPRRIFDAETGNFEPNPDYHEPAPMAPARHRGPAAEPRRIFNAETGHFELNPDYGEPAAVKRTAQIAKPNTEPARIFDAETDNFEPNLDYHDPATVAFTQHAGRAAESRGVSKALTRNFELHPGYHKPAPVKRTAHSAQPKPRVARNFDAETGNVGPNPLYCSRTLT